MLDTILINSPKGDLADNSLLIFRDGVLEFFTGMVSPSSYANSPVGGAFSNLDNLPSSLNNYKNDSFNLDSVSKLADSWSNKFIGDTSSLVNPNNIKTINNNLNNIDSYYDRDGYSLLSNSWSNKFIGNTSNLLESNRSESFKNNFDHLNPVISAWSDKFIGNTSNILEISKPLISDNNFNNLNSKIGALSDGFIENTSNMSEISKPSFFKNTFEPLEPIVKNNFPPLIEPIPVSTFPKYGSLDNEHIDDLNIKPFNSFPKNYFEKPFEPSYSLMAQMDIVNSENKFPDFKEFSNLSEYKHLNPIEKTSKYLDYRNNLTNLKESEFKSGINFDTNTFIHIPKEAVKVTDIFRDRMVVDTFAKSKEIEVNNTYLKNIAFFDPAPNKFDDERSIQLKSFMEDAPTAYDINTKNIFMSNNINSNDLNNGLLYHEKFHSKIRQDYEPEFFKLESKYDFKTNDKFENTIKSFEEVAADKMTFDFMGKNPLFVKTIENKYSEYNPPTKENFINQIGSILDKEYDNPILFSRLPESITTLNNVGSPLGPVVFDELNSYDFLAAGKRAMKQHKLFNTILNNEKIDFNPLFNYFDKSKGDKL
ncbi:MAG: hypothetical protein ACP5N1_02060 [Candidatus Woesearchaeota archaeon]